MQRTFEIVIDFNQHQASDDHFEEFMRRVKAHLTSGLPAGQGTAVALLLSVKEKGTET